MFFALGFEDSVLCVKSDVYYQALKKQVRDGEEGEYLDEEYPKREDLEITVWNKRLASIN